MNGVSAQGRDWICNPDAVGAVPIHSMMSYDVMVACCTLTASV